MDHFEYRNGELYCDGVAASALAEKYGTPLYVYSARTVEHHYRALTEAFAGLSRPPLICYSVKANSNMELLRLLGSMGCGFDVVSGGELHRVEEATGSTSNVVYAGVGKTTAEIEQALRSSILLFNVEAESELARIHDSAQRLGVVASVAIRVNPDVDPKTHRYITTGKRENKFGIDLIHARRVLEAARDLPAVRVHGLHIHLGSQITDTAPYVEGIQRVLDFLDSGAATPHDIRYLDIGGGFGVHYQGQEALPATAFADAITPLVKDRDLQIILEPGRFIMANAGILLTQVITAKKSGPRRFAICDAGMNDLMRPALYQSYHHIAPARGSQELRDYRPTEPQTDGEGQTDIVGPICESGDFLGINRNLPEIAEGDLLAVFGAGAYGMAMASNYNTRTRPAEVIVDGDQARLIRRRESLDDLLRQEREARSPLEEQPKHS